MYELESLVLQCCCAFTSLLHSAVALNSRCPTPLAFLSLETVKSPYDIQYVILFLVYCALFMLSGQWTSLLMTMNNDNPSIISAYEAP